MRISIFGLGYVGATVGACIADLGHEVIAVDTNAARVSCIQAGRSPVSEPGLNELIAAGVSRGALMATTDCEEGVLNSDMSLICVETPGNEDGTLKLDYIRSVCSQIGVALKKKNGFHSVILRSMVVPGTTRSVVIPILEECSGKTAGVDFGFGNNPEFLRESTAIYDYFNPPKIVIGALDDKTAKAISQLYKGLKAPEVVTSLEVAEGVKYADNAWCALKAGFANEIGTIMKKHGVDSRKVMDIFSLETKLHISAI
jgi:GDP-mannose 6-dehydrogenase